MSLKQWFDNGWIKQHRSSRQEIADLLAIVERDLNDARFHQTGSLVLPTMLLLSSVLFCFVSKVSGLVMGCSIIAPFRRCH
jgi:hypothetical protein